jgi:sodium/hydrogen antiporter
MDPLQILIAAISSLDKTLAVLGVLLIVGAWASGLARRSFLSLTAVFVLAGFLLGKGGLEVLDFGPRSGFIQALAIVALVVILFRDGLETEAEMLQTAWHLPFRKLVLAMPLTALIVAAAAKLMTDFSWTEALLLGALLSPTDPVLTSAVITNPRVPRLVRHSLNLESGMNDGLALPAVLAFAAALEPGGGDFVWWRFVIQDVGLGLLYGGAVGFLASWLLPRRTALGYEVSTHQKALFGLGVAFGAYGLATGTEPHANGFIAVFVAAIVLGIRRPDIRESFERRSEELIEVVKLGVFVVFGSLFTLDALFGEGWAAVGIVAVTLLVARPVAVFAALTGSREVDAPTKAFMAWFGPKGVATMTFSLLILGKGIEAGGRIADLAALSVLVSVIAHGVTDTAGAEWMGRHAERTGRAG